MGKIVAIGGGELKLNETIEIDKFIVEFTDKYSPNALFIPTASGEPQGYIDVFNQVYRDTLNCKTDVLLLKTDELDDCEIENKILSADLIYVGGGNTAMMIDIWKSKKVDVYLRKAYYNGTVLSGLSAGAICWFTYGHSDSNKTDDGTEWEYILTGVLGILNAIICPHYNEDGRKGFDEIMKTQTMPGIAIENNCAIVIEDNEFKIIKSDNTRSAYLLKNDSGIITKTLLSNENYLPLDVLLEK